MRKFLDLIKKKLLILIEQFINSLLYNGLYIFIAFLFPYVIYKLDAGREIILNIMDENIGLNISLILLSFFLLSFSVWCVPTLAISLWKLATGNQSKKEVLYNYLTTIYSGSATSKNRDCNNNKVNVRKQIPIKYFAVFPWVMFVFTCIQIFSLTISTIVAVIFLIVMFTTINNQIVNIEHRISKFLIVKTQGEKNTVNTFNYLSCVLLFVLVIFLPAILDAFFPELLKNTFLGPKILIGINYLLVFVFYAFISYLENLDAKVDAMEQFRISNISYIFVLAITITAIVALYFINESLNISTYNPIFIVVTIVALFIMCFDMFFTSQLLLTHIASVVKSGCSNSKCELAPTDGENLQKYRLIVYATIVLFIYFSFFHSLNRHDIRQTATDTSTKLIDSRKSLDNYCKNWLDQRQKNVTSKDSIQTIFLVSGPGGGSRAAVWFYLGMKKLDEIYGDKFYKNIFSISTVSGSTTGANMYLAEKYLNLKTNISSNLLAEKIYSKNYFSSTFYGLLIGDGINGIAGKYSHKTHDRNYFFQKEEMNSFSSAYNLDSKETEAANKYFENDFMYPYQKEGIPLFLINTSLVDYGKRGVFSPIKLNDFSLGVDLYSMSISQCCKNGFGLPMVTCVNQSQAFPLINSFNYLEGAGRLCDGGLYDNSGCTTTLEVYQGIRNYITKNNLSNIRIVCLNILNGEITNDFQPEYSAASILNSFKGAVEVLFSGHETYAYVNLERQIKNYNIKSGLKNTNNFAQDEFITLNLNGQYNLTRMLSKKAIREMCSDMEKQIKVTQADIRRRQIIVD